MPAGVRRNHAITLQVLDEHQLLLLRDEDRVLPIGMLRFAD